MKLLLKIFKNILFYSFIIALSVIFASLAPSIHERYLRNEVGQVVIKVIKDKEAISGGTGFHIKAPSGAIYILTNAHVAKMNGKKIGDTVLVLTPDGKRQMNRRIIDISEDSDLALIEALPGTRGIKVASNIEVGDQIAIVGHPLLNALTISRGQIIARKDISLIDGFNVPKEECVAKSKKHSFVEVEDAFLNAMGLRAVCVVTFASLETNALTYPGNSGSVVVNFFGNLIGVVFAGNSVNAWGYLVPLDEIKSFLSTY